MRLSKKKKKKLQLMKWCWNEKHFTMYTHPQLTLS